MSLKKFVTLHAIVSIAAGIALALYAPLILAFFGVPQIPEDNPVLYWMIASFARLSGAILFGFGFLLYAARALVDDPAVSADWRRGIVFALLLATGMGLFVSLTQQFSIWGSAAGWVFIAVFALFFAGYGFFLVRGQDNNVLTGPVSGS